MDLVQQRTISAVAAQRRSSVRLAVVAAVVALALAIFVGSLVLRSLGDQSTSSPNIETTQLRAFREMEWQVAMPANAGGSTYVNVWTTAYTDL